jgi:hypothetical protein
MVSGETISQRRRCFRGSVILVVRDVYCSFRIPFLAIPKTRKSFFREKTFVGKKVTWRGFTPSSPRGRFGLVKQGEPHLKVRFYLYSKSGVHNDLEF